MIQFSPADPIVIPLLRPHPDGGDAGRTGRCVCEPIWAQSQ